MRCWFLWFLLFLSTLQVFKLATLQPVNLPTLQVFNSQPLALQVFQHTTDSLHFTFVNSAEAKMFFSGFLLVLLAVCQLAGSSPLPVSLV